MQKEPLVCDFAKARIGCKMIADHIFELAEASNAILDFVEKGKDSKGALRSAYVLNLVAYEEAGKLFMIWRALADAEGNKADRIRIEKFEYHEPKGDLAGDLCCQMLGYAESKLVELTNMLDKAASVPIPVDITLIAYAFSTLKSTVAMHKERVYRIMRHFKQEREDAMYIDSRSGNWVAPPQLSSEMLAMDCILLETVAKAANAYLLADLPFSLATKALSDLSKDIKSDEADQFVSALEKGDQKWFGILKGKGT